jgi:hypothetical protein
MSIARHLQVIALVAFSGVWAFAQDVKPAAAPAAGADAAPAKADPAKADPAKAGAPKADAAKTPAATDDEGPASPDDAKHSSLGVRQARVKQLVKDLRAKFDELAKSKAIEEEQRERIYAALATVEKSGLETDIAAIVAMLDGRELTGADAKQQLVIIELKKLILILTEDKDARLEQMKQLEEYKKIINGLIKDENKQIRNTDKVSEKDRTLNDLDAQIKKVEELIRRENNIVGKTGEAREQGIQKLDPVANEQRDVRNQTEALAKQVGGQTTPVATGNEGKPNEGKPGEGKPSEGKPGEGKPGENKPEEAKPGEAKPGEAKPGEAKPGEAKPGEANPGEAKPGEAKPGEAKPGEAKPGEGKPGEAKPGEGKSGEGGMGGEGGKDGMGGMGGESGMGGGQPTPPGDQPGEKPLAKAAEHQKAAEDNLGKGKGRAAESDEKKAVAELEKAAADLKNERNRIATLPPEAFENMAKQQDQTADKTGDLSKQMAKDAADKAKKSGGGMGGMGGMGGDGESGDGEPPPGKKGVEQAQNEMQGASGKLRRQMPKQAKGDQKKAVDQLKVALDEIEKKLAQLRQEMQQERLAALEAHFRQMLEMQKPITLTTGSLDRVRASRQWNRKETLDLAKLAKGESELSAMAQKGLDIIVEDGTSIVFPRVVEQLRDDLMSVSKLIEAKNAGSYTQAMQREIESTLKELIEALEEAQKQNDQQSDQPPSDQDPGEQEEPPLLPNSAELKLLKASQLRVNRRTKSFDDVRPDGDLEPVMRDEVRKISKQQDNVAEMTRAMIERN